VTRTDGPGAPPRGRLAGKIALVAGAGQTPGEHIGNGRATALLFAREGARVVVFDREREAAEATAAELQSAGGEACVQLGDVTSEQDCRAAIAASLASFGGLDILHHNVGVGLGDGWAEGIELAAWESILRINAGGALMMAKAALPVLREQGHGVITNVSSIAAVVAGVAPMSNPPHAYKMSKAALNALTLSLAQAYAPHGIRVNAILPGLIDTPMGVDAVAQMLGVPRADYARRRDEAVPLKGGMGTAWDVAHAALFLASDEARFITGALLAVDGGQSTRVG
jgi:NAD(P)-dependent dehydrogenase (short-subunit alcohol dehydrogenase family)